jgi:hypothetical protein
MLTSIVPDYQRLTEILNEGTKLQCIISKKGRYTKFKIVEYFVGSLELYSTCIDHNNCIFWTEQQLQTWIGVKRVACDEWYFNKKSDAEKFMTLFNLKWAK